MINVVTISGEEIRIDNSKKAIAKIKDGFKSGDQYHCPGCPYSSMCGEGVVIGVSWDTDFGLTLWMRTEKSKPNVVACCNTIFVKIKK